MEEKYWKYLYYILGYCYGLKIKSKKKGMFILKFEGVKVVLINDYNNRRCLLFFYKDITRQIYRVSFHGYYVREIRRKLVKMVQNIQNDDNYFTDVLMKRRSYSYKQERAFKNYLSYGYKLSKGK